MEFLTNSFKDVELGAEFAAGAFAVSEKTNEIGVGQPLGAFRDIRGEGDGRVLQLVAECVLSNVLGPDADLDRQATTSLPGFEFCEIVFTHAVGVLASCRLDSC